MKGEMAAAVNVFRENAIEADHLRHQQQESREGRRTRVWPCAISPIPSSRKPHRAVDAISKQTSQMAANATQMAKSAGTVSESSQTVAAAATEARPISAPLRPLPRNSAPRSAAYPARSVLAKARPPRRSRIRHAAQQTIAELSNAVTQISAVTKLITDIASQTNLLALNATIRGGQGRQAGRTSPSWPTR